MGKGSGGGEVLRGWGTVVAVQRAECRPGSGVRGHLLAVDLGEPACHVSGLWNGSGHCTCLAEWREHPPDIACKESSAQARHMVGTQEIAAVVKTRRAAVFSDSREAGCE